MLYDEKRTPRVIVWDAPDHRLLKLLARCDLYIAAPESGSCDILAVSPACESAGPSPCACQTAVAPGTLPPAFWPSVQARRVVTYGWPAHNTLTMSSAEDAWALALQRELLTVDGLRVEPQEIILSPLKGPFRPENAELALCAAGVLLTAGLPVSDLFY